MASCLLLAFDYSYTLNTLGDYIRRATPDAETMRDFLELMGQLRVDDKDKANRL